jgi:hypothetical protein
MKYNPVKISPYLTRRIEKLFIDAERAKANIDYIAMMKNIELPVREYKIIASETSKEMSDNAEEVVNETGEIGETNETNEEAVVDEGTH